MSEIENQNKNIRIQQQKDKLKRRIIYLIVFMLLITVVFVYINKNAVGKESTIDVFSEQLTNGVIKEIYLNQTKIQYITDSGNAYWMHRRDTVEQYVLEKWNSLSENERPILVSGTTTTISIMNILYPILLIGSLIFMIVFISKQLKSSNNKSFEFVKNRARIYPSKTKFSDVAGADEEKQELEDVVDFLKNPKKYTELGAKIPKGVILVGPPGTGKTLLAKAVAGEANVPFFTISGSDFMELFVGVGASRVRDLFETAKKAKPCIIFIDEIDAVGRQRGAGLGGGNDEREQTLNQLLVQMDGFEENEGIIIMAATNRVDILDPALLRPGRFDRRINISIPDVKGREAILNVHARNKKFDKTIDFKTIARITSGFTGAELENLLNEAAIMVAKENRKAINEQDIQKAIMKVTLGPQKRSRVINEKDKFDTAIHESGHALISKLAKEKTPVHEVSIIPRGGAGGYTVSTDDDTTVYFKEKLLCKIQMLLGGITAEKLYVGDISTGASNDLKRATSIARRMVTEWGMSQDVGMVYCGSGDEVFIGKSYQERMPYSETQGSKIDEEIKKIIDECQKVTEKLLVDNKDILMTMTNILLEKETIYAEEVDMIIEGKSKEEVIEYIENKDKKKPDNNSNSATQNTEIKSSNNENSSFVDDLIKKAEEKEKLENEKKEDVSCETLEENVENSQKTETDLIEENLETKTETTEAVEEIKNIETAEKLEENNEEVKADVSEEKIETNEVKEVPEIVTTENSNKEDLKIENQKQENEAENLEEVTPNEELEPVKDDTKKEETSDNEDNK